MIRLRLCCAYLNAHYQEVAEVLWLRGQMFVLVLWNLWDKKLGQLALIFMNVLEVFNSNMWWWYWKFLDMGIIGITFLGSLLILHNFMFFSMKSLILMKTFMGGCIERIFVSIPNLWRTYFQSIQCFHLQFRIFNNNDFHAFIDYKKRC
jgi:hypothetical protein